MSNCNNDPFYGINNGLLSLSDTVNDIDTNTDLIIRQQNNISTIIKDETNRLQDMKQGIDIAKTSQDRLISLNENYSKRYYQYLKIITLFAITLAIIAVLLFFKVSSAITTIVSIITISFTLIYSTTIYVMIANRDSIYFDEINYNYNNTSTVTDTDTVTNNVTTSSSSNNVIATCNNSDCCSSSTVWDTSLKLCIPIQNAFTTLSMAYNDNDNDEKRSCCNNKFIRKSNEHLLQNNDLLSYNDYNTTFYAKI